jgi:hypothetical protein
MKSTLPVFVDSIDITAFLRQNFDRLAKVIWTKIIRSDLGNKMSTSGYLKPYSDTDSELRLCLLNFVCSERSLVREESDRLWNGVLEPRCVRVTIPLCQSLNKFNILGPISHNIDQLTVNFGALFYEKINDLEMSAFGRKVQRGSSFFVFSRQSRIALKQGWKRHGKRHVNCVMSALQTEHGKKCAEQIK